MILNNISEKIKSSDFRRLLPYLALVICLVVTASVSLISYRHIRENAQQRFNDRAQEVTEKIKDRIHAYRTILRGGAGLFSASDYVTRQEWKSYIESLQLGDVYPGIQGIGFTKLIKLVELKEHIRQIRAEGFSNYTVRPEGSRDEYTSIIYLEPFDARNQRALGFDMFSEKTRRVAMERARDTGKTSLSGKITLVQETEKDVQSGFLIYVPVYKKGMPVESVEERRAALYGYAYSPLRIEDFIKGIFGNIPNDIDIQIYDGGEPSNAALMFDSDGCGKTFPKSKKSFFSQKIVIDLYTQNWTFIFTSLPAFEKTIGHHEVWNMFAAGIAISIFIFLFMRSQETAREHALSLAYERTKFAEERLMSFQKLQKTAEEAESANRAKSDFLANMSHELRTPLNVILGFSEVLELGMAGPLTDGQKEHIRDIHESGKHLLSLINDILDLSKVEAGKMELDLSEIKVDDLISSSLLMFREKAMKHNIKIEAKINEEIGEITADERKIKQVLFNLLSNAFKFTPDGGSVLVTARMDNDNLEISVEDTGIGISEEDQKKLFLPFHQIDSGYQKKAQGTGLGLHLCKIFVKLHGGRIWIESEAGKGSRFVFIIPADGAPRTGS